MKLDESGWKWRKVDEGGKKWITMDETGWMLMRVDERWWKWMKVDECGWKWTKVEKSGWKWIKVGESWVKYSLALFLCPVLFLCPFLFLSFYSNLSKLFTVQYLHLWWSCYNPPRNFATLQLWLSHLFTTLPTTSKLCNFASSGLSFQIGAVVTQLYLSMKILLFDLNVYFPDYNDEYINNIIIIETCFSS